MLATALGLTAYVATSFQAHAGGGYAAAGVEQRADLIADLEVAAGPAVDADDTASTDGTETDPEALRQKRAILSLDGDRAYGEYLGGECVTCHRDSGGAGIPPIRGLSASYFILTLVEYRAGLRENPVMKTTAARLSDEEIAALAAYFAVE